jgi:hypothetical protein
MRKVKLKMPPESSDQKEDVKIESSGINKHTLPVDPKDCIELALNKCMETLSEDIGKMTAKERVMLWKDLKDFIVPKNSKESDVPGNDVSKIEWVVKHTNSDEEASN